MAGFGEPTVYALWDRGTEQEKAGELSFAQFTKLLSQGYSIIKYTAKVIEIEKVSGDGRGGERRKTVTIYVPQEKPEDKTY